MKSPESFFVLLLTLTIYSTAGASDTHDPDSVAVRFTSPCDFTECGQNVQLCQGVCALLYQRAAVSTLSLAPQPNKDSVAPIAAPENKLKEPFAREFSNRQWPIGYIFASATAVEPNRAEMPQPHWSHLPIWGQEAEAKGYRIPLPFGIGATFYDARQPVNVRDLKLGVGRSPPESAEFVKVGRPINSWQQNVSSRFDVWPFPFFNLYGVAGYTRGNTRGVVTAIGPLLGIINEELPLLAGFHGPTFGGGMTLAGGFKVAEWRNLHAFMIGDVNHTVTLLSFKGDTLISHTRPHVTVASPRAGLRGEVTERISAAVWVGAMYQRIEEEVAGSVAGRQIEFVINQRAASPWNTLIGGQIEFGRHLNLLVEGGVGPRSSILTGVVFRF